MTQFALIRANDSHEGFKPLGDLGQDSFVSIAKRLFPNADIDTIYVPEYFGKSIDSLMLEAQKFEMDEQGFEDTQFYKVVIDLAQNADELVLWYGSDYDDLECVDSIPALLESLREVVSDSFCEAYIRYKKRE